MKTEYPRSTAIRVLTRVLSDHQPLDEALSEALGAVQPEHRAWLQEVCSGTLRWKGRIDLAIDSVALKKKPTGWLRKALLVAAYQLIVQERTPHGRVVSETVDEVRSKEGDAPAKFANALLRKVSEHAVRWRDLPADPAAKPPEAAAWASLPEWLWWKLIKDHGVDWAIRYAQASLDRPMLWVRAKDRSWRPDWTEPGPVENSLRVSGTPPAGAVITQWEGFSSGDFFVQDVSSQILVEGISSEVRRSLASVERPSALDLCAAPGGKSIGLAWSGLRVTSTDRDQARLRILKQSVDRAAPEVRLIERGAVSGLEPQDLVWVDAPCSGSGILRRHPDVRWLKREEELVTLNRLQESLAREAWGKVKPGGFFAYSVCSVLKQEGPALIRKLELPGTVVKEWFLLPQDPPFGDGFWAILIRKS